MIDSIFVGFLSQGGPTHSGSFIVGKVVDEDEEQIQLKNPIWLQRALSGMANNQPVFTHQVVVDPLLQCNRDGKMVFQKVAFTGSRVLDPEIAKDAEMILSYDKNLTAMHAALSGIALPPGGGKISSLKPV
jgi:hypothetical protein